MVLWNERTVREHAYLGPNVRRVDLWGRESPLPVETIDGIRQQVVVREVELRRAQSALHDLDFGIEIIFYRARHGLVQTDVAADGLLLLRDPGEAACRGERESRGEVRRTRHLHEA